ncbi:mitogen-activated protein kinase kinase kinase ANP1-like [Fagus crenata]
MVIFHQVSTVELNHITFYSSNNSDDDMWQIDKDDSTVQEVKLGSSLMLRTSRTRRTGINPYSKEHISEVAGCSSVFGEGNKDFSFPCGPSLSEDDDELTE